MNARGMGRGGATVGDLGGLDALRLGAVVYLRLWCAGQAERQQVVQDFVTVLGESDAQMAVAALDGVCTLCARAGRRPILRHGVSCRCLGADESWFANLVEAACSGADDDALLIAGHLLRPESAPCAIGMAGTLGLAIRQVAGSTRTTPTGASGAPGTTLTKAATGAVPPGSPTRAGTRLH